MADYRFSKDVLAKSREDFIDFFKKRYPDVFNFEKVVDKYYGVDKSAKEKPKPTPK